MPGKHRKASPRPEGQWVAISRRLGRWSPHRGRVDASDLAENRPHRKNATHRGAGPATQASGLVSGDQRRAEHECLPAHQRSDHRKCARQVRQTPRPGAFSSGESKEPSEEHDDAGGPNPDHRPGEESGGQTARPARSQGPASRAVMTPARQPAYRPAAWLRKAAPGALASSNAATQSGFASGPAMRTPITAAVTPSARPNRYGTHGAASTPPITMAGMSITAKPGV